jgi:hypothetical protein
MHPLPEDVSRASTYDIVEKIRCEAKAGLRDVPAGHPFLDYSAIGYDFEFKITESNNLGLGETNPQGVKGELKFEKPGARDGSNLTWDLTGSATKQRQNDRQFRIVETLAELKQADCPEEPKRPDWIYPIAGGIGMDELVHTYVSLERLTDFAGGFVKNPDEIPDPTKPSETRPAVFSDTLQFTTKVSGGLTPTLTLQTITNKVRLSKATIGASTSREDLHNVTVALAQGTGKRVEPPSALARMARSAPIALSRQGARKVDAVSEQAVPATSRVLFELERRRLLTEDSRLATRFLGAFRPE